MNFWLGFFCGGALVGLAAMQFLKGYREGMREAVLEGLRAVGGEEEP